MRAIPDGPAARRDDLLGADLLIFDTEDQARAAAPPASTWTAPGIAVTGIEFRGVAATA
jgi:hypothetical protein